MTTSNNPESNTPIKPATKKPARKPPHNKLKRPTNDERLLRFLSRANGSTIAEMQGEIKMQVHSIRGAMSNLKKKMGFEIAYDRETKRYSSAR